MTDLTKGKSGKFYLFDSLNISVLLTIVIILLAVNRGSLNLITWDNFGMYCYLPSFFIDGTFHQGLDHFEKLNQTYDFSSTLYQFNIVNEVAFTKYTGGLAVLLTPFFLMAHLFAHVFGFPTDGYSEPYSIAFAVGSLFYVVLGIFLLRKLLLYYFEDKVVAWVLICIFLGTNILINSSLSGSNILAFVSLIALLICTIKFHEKPNFGNGILLGISLGLLGLIRVPDLVFGLIPAFWNIDKYGSIWKKIKFFMVERRWTLFSVILSFFVMMSLQLLFWKSVSGHYLIDSYANNPGEGFDWFSPHTIPFLFSFKKGWLVYTPLAIIALIGLWQMLKKGGNFRLLTVTFLIFLYVASTWTTWWYAGSFSSRAMLDSYAILAIGLGYYIKNTRWRKVTLVFVVLLVVLNLFQSWQYRNGIISKSQMTRKYYFSTFGQISSPTLKQITFLEPDYLKFADLPLVKMKLKKLHSWNVSQQNIILDSTNFYTKDNNFDLSSFKLPYHLYLAEAVWTYNPLGFTGIDGFIPNISMSYNGKIYGWRGVDMHTLEVDTLKNEIKMIYLVPDMRTPHDELRVQIWNQGEKGHLEVDNLKVNLYEVIGKR